MKLNRKNSKSIAAGSSGRSFDKARTARGLFGAALSIATLTASLAAPPALHAQSTAVSFAGVQNTVVDGLNRTTEPSGLLPDGAAVDGAGNLYITDYLNKRILKLTPAGVQTTLPITGLNNLGQIAVDSAGDLFFTDSGAYPTPGRVMEYTATGNLNVLYQRSSFSPEGVAVNSMGDVFFADLTTGAVFQITSGQQHTWIISTISGEPFGVTVDSQNNVYYTDYENNAVVEIPVVPNQQWQGGGLVYSGSITLPASGLNAPRGVTVDKNNNVYIADTGNNRVIELPLMGSGSQTTLPFSGLASPEALAFDGEGNLFVAKLSQVVELEKASVNFGAVNVCQSGQTSPAPCSNTIPVTFNVTASGNLGGATVYMPGMLSASSAKNAEFAVAPGGTCTGAVTAGSTCTVNVTFNPKYPGLRSSSVWLTDAYGNILATLPIYGTGVAPQVAFSQAPQTLARIPVATNQPTSVVADALGNLFVAEENGTVMEFVGNGQQVVATGLGSTCSLAVDGADTAYIADPNNNRVLKVPMKASKSTIGSGLSMPRGVAVDGEGNVFIADTGNNRIVRIQGGRVPNIRYRSQGWSRPTA
jgi:sugar lactone lactonase YvrE